MELNHRKIRKIQTQRYRPTQTTLHDTNLDEYYGKEFSRGNVAERFHENTKVDRAMERELIPSAQQFTADPDFAYMQARLDPDYPSHDLVELPDPDDLEISLQRALARRRSRRDHASEGISLSRLSTLLGRSCGVSGIRDVPEDGEEVWARQTFRAYPSGGGLYPVEIYLAVMNESEDLEPGLYYYNANRHALRVLKRDPGIADRTDELFSLRGEDAYDPATSAVTFLLTGSFWRSMAKYGPRGYRYVLQESGHLGQNVLLVAQALGLAAFPLAAYRDHGVNDYLGIDGVNEAVIYTVPVGVPAGDGDA